MTWIDTDYERTFTVEAPAGEVAEFLSNPSGLRHCMGDLERAEEIDEQTFRWVLEEVGAKNVTFQGDYSVRYSRDGTRVTWESTGDGTMRTEGEATVEQLDDQRSRVDYRESLSSDLPIPRLAKKVFSGIVDREVSKGVDEFLDSVIEYLEAGQHRADDAQ